MLFLGVKMIPKILQWHPIFWKPIYDFALYWSKTNPSVQLWKYSTLLFHRCDRLVWRCIRLQWRQKVGSCSAHVKQGGCRVRQEWDFAYLGRTELSSGQKIKMMQCALLYCDWKQEFSIWCFPFVNVATLPGRIEQSFSGSMFKTLHRWKLP